MEAPYYVCFLINQTFLGPNCARARKKKKFELYVTDGGFDHQQGLLLGFVFSSCLASYSCRWRNGLITHCTKDPTVSFNEQKRDFFFPEKWERDRSFDRL